MQPKRVTSRENPLFKELLKLAGSSHRRRKTARTLLEGMRLVEAYHAAGGVPEHLVVTESALKSTQLGKLLAASREVPVTVLADALFSEVSQLKTPAGILALIAIPKPVKGPDNTEFMVLLEGIQDPGNLGSILRSAAAAGVERVCLSRDCADTWSPKVLRAAMGAHFSFAIAEGTDLAQAARRFSGKVVAMDPHADRSIYQAKLSGPLAFIIGNEGAGISPLLRQAADEVVAIPMAGKTESLNAAAAAAVCFFERVRQTERTLRNPPGRAA